MATDIPQFAPAEHRPARRQLWEKEQQSAAVRLMIGDAIGDAFGFGVEMQDADWIRKAVTRFDTWPDNPCLLYTSPSPRDRTRSRMPSSA